MEDVERGALSTYPLPPPFWKRYVNDTLTVLHQDEVQRFHKHLYSIETTIQFSVEKESEGTLPFLDTKIMHHSDGPLSTVVFRKSTHGQVLGLQIPSFLGTQGGSGLHPVQPC